MKAENTNLVARLQSVLGELEVEFYYLANDAAILKAPEANDRTLGMLELARFCVSTATTCVKDAAVVALVNATELSGAHAIKA